jgi:predicted PolB exonuclease-like 3'-5' exonuclease
LLFLNLNTNLRIIKKINLSINFIFSKLERRNKQNIVNYIPKKAEMSKEMSENNATKELKFIKTEMFLTFDLETIPRDYDSFSESQREYIVRYAKDEEDAEQKKAQMALSPLTAQLVVIGMQLNEVETYKDISTNSETLKTKNTSKFAYILDDSKKDGEIQEDTLSTGDGCKYMNEKTMLEQFWSIFKNKKYANVHLISFNGRNFDAPFIMLRSALLGIRPSRNLMEGTKFNYHLHTDLIDELCFFAPSSYGATKRFNFDFYAREFGLQSPKAEGIDGSKVKDFFLDGKVNEVAEYCMRDVTTTWELYLIWRERLKFK